MLIKILCYNPPSSKCAFAYAWSSSTCVARQPSRTYAIFWLMSENIIKYVTNLQLLKKEVG